MHRYSKSPFLQVTLSCKYFEMGQMNISISIRHSNSNFAYRYYYSLITLDGVNLKFTSYRQREAVYHKLIFFAKLVR